MSIARRVKGVQIIGRGTRGSEPSGYAWVMSSDTSGNVYTGLDYRDSSLARKTST